MSTDDERVKEEESEHCQSTTIGSKENEPVGAEEDEALGEEEYEPLVPSLAW